MEHHALNGGSSSSHLEITTTEPVRSRWTPKPQQIFILESIFNSGMINPPKDETVRIRKLLQKFGSVGDANVFYWFQNRRSRSRRRQKQLQSGLAVEGLDQRMAVQGESGGGDGGGVIQYHHGLLNNSTNGVMDEFSSSDFLVRSSSSSSSGGFGADFSSLFSVSSGGEMIGFQQIQDASNLHYQPGFITVFINGVPTNAPKGLVDMKAMFGENVVLLHSSGVPITPMGTFQHGENYFLVPRAV